MKVLLVVQKPQFRGAEVSARHLAGAFKQRGHDARLLCLYAHEGDLRLPLEAEDQVLDGREDHPLERWLTFHPGLLKAVSGAIRRFDPEIVQVHGGRTVKYGALVSWLSPRRRWSLVYRNIGDPRVWLRSPVHRAWYRGVVAPRIDAVLGVSDHTLEGVREMYGLRVPMARIPVAVDPEALKPTRSAPEVRRELETPQDRTVIVTVGSLTPEKRPDRVLEALAGLDEPSQPVLWMVGDGPLRPALEARARRLGIARRVRFLGIRRDIGDLLHAADVFVLASDTEGLPSVLLEAGYAGLPAVATRVGGVSEALIHQETGWVVEPGDDDELIRRLEELASSPESRRAMGRRAAEHVRRHFLLDPVTERYLDFYRRLRERPA